MMDSRSFNEVARNERLSTRAVYLMLVSLAAFWLLLIAAAPLLAHAGHGLSAFVIYRSFAVLCHQIPARSFSLFGFPLAVCARCAGLYAGGFLGLCLYPLVRSTGSTRFLHRRWLLLAILPTAVDFAGGGIGLFANTHASRAVTGAIAGLAATFYLVPGVMQMLRCNRLTR